MHNWGAMATIILSTMFFWGKGWSLALVGPATSASVPLVAGAQWDLGA